MIIRPLVHADVLNLIIDHRRVDPDQGRRHGLARQKCGGTPAFTGSAPSACSAPPSCRRPWIVGVACAIVVILHLFFDRTLLGKAMRAVASDREAARLMGIDVSRIVMLSFALGAAVGAIGGLIVTPVTLTIYDAGTLLGLKGFAAAVTGGLGNTFGGIAGGWSWACSRPSAAASSARSSRTWRHFCSSCSCSSSARAVSSRAARASAYEPSPRSARRDRGAAGRSHAHATAVQHDDRSRPRCRAPRARPRPGSGRDHQDGQHLLVHRPRGLPGRPDEALGRALRRGGQQEGRHRRPPHRADAATRAASRRRPCSRPSASSSRTRST